MSKHDPDQILSRLTHRVDAIELYRTDVTVPRHFSFGTWWNRQHLIVKVATGGHAGWGEVIAAINRPELDVLEVGGCLRALIGLPIPQAIESVRRSGWSNKLREATEMALIDLAGRVTQMPAAELLGLEGRAPVPGLHCVLSADPAEVRAGARCGLQRNLRTHLKVKLYGDPETDLSVISAAREVIGDGALLVGDVNGGYGRPDSDAALSVLAAQLRRLNAAGLSACEDPAKMSVEQWVALQGQVGDLDLLPDEPLRPAGRAIDTVVPGMGRIYNIHPGCAASILDAVRLGRKVRAMGAQLMIGDDSLIGPACTAWQQLAVGLGAAWVEAIEKPEESDAISRYATERVTAQLPDGRFGIVLERPGFGLTVDEAELLASSQQHRVVR